MDARCWRCNQRLFTNDTAVGRLQIKCERCKAINSVTLDKESVTVR